MPIARAFVPRWVLMGGISTDRCLVAPAGSQVRSLLPFGVGGAGKGAGGSVSGLSFGTLLGPEITGPCFCVAVSVVSPCVGVPGWGRVGVGCVVSGFPAHAVVRVLWGAGPGVMGLLVENCIVDASILKRSNF